MKRAKIVFISTPALGNLVPNIEFAKVLAQKYQSLSATILIITIPGRPLIQSYIDSLTTATTASAGNVSFLLLPAADPPSPDQFEATIAYLSLLIQNHTSQVKDALVNLISDSDSSGQVAGFFIDMFCTPFIDVAKELNIPCYLYYASPASFLSFMFHLPILDAQISAPTEFRDSSNEFNILGFSNTIPVNVFPSFLLKRNIDGYSWPLHHARRYRETKGIVVNTFQELEPYCLDSLVNSAADYGVPPVYPIGPVVDHNGPAKWHQDSWGHENVMKWLDNQEPSSVVFLSFGSMGSLNGAQVTEIAKGLEKAGYPFLWAIREAPKDKRELPTDYTNLEGILPCGFLERTKGKGLLCGLVPQVTILAHKAIGGFVSHCGWNSILESLYYGVPIGTWPLYAEQHLNAFEMVKELKLAVEITMDYRDGNTLVSSEQVASWVKKLMDSDGEVRQRFKEMSDKCKQVWKEDGSSSVFLGQLVDILLAEI